MDQLPLIFSVKAMTHYTELNTFLQNSWPLFERVARLNKLVATEQCGDYVSLTVARPICGATAGGDKWPRAFVVLQFCKATKVKTLPM
jgi:hypothetical protein